MPKPYTEVKRIPNLGSRIGHRIFHPDYFGQGDVVKELGPLLVLVRLDSGLEDHVSIERLKWIEDTTMSEAEVSIMLEMEDLDFKQPGAMRRHVQLAKKLKKERGEE